MTSLHAIAPSTPLANLVDLNPRRALVLERLGIDYCCGGVRTLETACADQGIAIQNVIAALVEADAGQPDPPLSADVELTDLIDEIIDLHHEYLRRALPEISSLLGRIAHAHGESHPETIQLREVFEPLRLDLIEHLNKEELVLFPLVRELAAGGGITGAVAHPIAALRHEHDEAGRALARIRSLTGDFTVPDDVCATFRATYQALQELEADIHLHVHKENNILFPRVEAPD